MKPDLFNVPDRILILLEGWTIEDLAIAKVTNLVKIKGIGLVTAKGIIETAKGELDKKEGQEKEAEWSVERSRLRERIAVQVVQPSIVVTQKEIPMSARVRRIREANA